MTYVYSGIASFVATLPSFAFFYRLGRRHERKGER
jgi:hypothetical protein